MSRDRSKSSGPLNSLFYDISKIIEFMEVKDNKTALACETSKSKSDAELYMNAVLKKDDYMTYSSFWNIAMFQEVVANVRINNVNRWIENPFTVPLIFRDNLLLKGRNAFLNSYIENNEYYRMINGLPPLNASESEYIYLSDELKDKFHMIIDEPVHLLSPIIQNKYINTDEYRNIILNNPDKKYLNYLGIYKIDSYSARCAKDFEIIRYPSNRSDINPNLLIEFSKLYNDYREYVMVTLYNPHLESLYINYRNFIGLLIMICTLLQINNKAVEMLHSKNFLDDSIIYEILSMYRIPNSLLLTNEIRRKLVSSIYKLIQKKGTDEIYDDIINILQYEDVKINKLLLINDQNSDRNEKPYFVQVDINDDDPYETITKGNAVEFNYDDIINTDPTWWDTEEVRKIVNEYPYNISNSKYITIEAFIPQIKYLFESIYFSRLILDNKAYTDEFMVEVPELFGTDSISLYDLLIFIISAMCMNNGLSGNIVTDTDIPIATAGFNFDINIDSFIEYINNSECVDNNKILSFIDNLTIKYSSDINRLYNDVINPMRDWLEYKITYADDRKEYVEYENIYRSLYTYDITRNKFLDDYRPPIEGIRIENNISKEEMLMYKHFYPRTFRGEAITVDEFISSRYYPFINRIYEIDWYIHVVIDTEYGSDDRGYVYFHDILNSNDLRELTNPDGTRVFMDYEDSDVGWIINNQAVEKALELIDQLDEDNLNKAYFMIDTPVVNSNGKVFLKDTKLPYSIRNGSYKKILHDKLLRDMQGLSNPPSTYKEYLYRKCPKLYDLLMKDDRFNRDKDSWLNDIMKIITTIEAELNIHIKYFEQATIGSEAFFKPLILLINRFKSTFIRIAKTSLRYIFDDKIDAGGNSNMLKLFDEVNLVIHFITLMNKGYNSQLGLYDTTNSINHKIIIKDFSTMINEKINSRNNSTGSLQITDEVKLFINHTNNDPSGNHSYWRSGDPNTGRWSEEDNIIMRTEKSIEQINDGNIDMEGWKDFVER